MIKGETVDIAHKHMPCPHCSLSSRVIAYFLTLALIACPLHGAYWC